MSYAYQAAMWCDECAQQIIDDLQSKGIEDDGTTDTYPQQCHNDEADCPQHCEGCHAFLENNLTAEGRQYVIDALRSSDEDSVAWTIWGPFYDLLNADTDHHMQPEYESGDWYQIESKHGTEWIPCHLVGHVPAAEAIDALADYLSNPSGYEGATVSIVSGVGTRLSAPGYLDSTEWTLCGSQDEARQYWLDQDVCPECGANLDERYHPCADHDPQWYVIAADVNWEDDSLYCDHCSQRIESAYGKDEPVSNSPAWKALDSDPFCRAYVECALWSSLDDYESQMPLDDKYGIEDISDECALSMLADCRAFQEETRDLLDSSGLSIEQQGHDFWLTRNGHGAGFWDRGIGKVGEQLTKAAKVYGSFDLIVGDDGKIYC